MLKMMSGHPLKVMHFFCVFEGVKYKTWGNGRIYIQVISVITEAIAVLTFYVGYKVDTKIPFLFPNAFMVSCWLMDNVSMHKTCPKFVSTPLLLLPPLTSPGHPEVTFAIHHGTDSFCLHTFAYAVPTTWIAFSSSLHFHVLSFLHYCTQKPLSRTLRALKCNNPPLSSTTMLLSSFCYLTFHFNLQSPLAD